MNDHAPKNSSNYHPGVYLENGLLNPDMPTQALRLHMRELTYILGYGE